MRNPWLLAAGISSGAAALLHLAVIFGGPSWYRFFGAGEKMARMAERGALRPALITLGIVAVLLVWAAYAFSGAGLLSPLPVMRVALVAISCALLGRASLYLFASSWRPDLPQAFMAWSSGIVLLMGLAFAIGTWTAWPTLTKGSI